MEEVVWHVMLFINITVLIWVWPWLWEGLSKHQWRQKQVVMEILTPSPPANTQTHTSHITFSVTGEICPQPLHCPGFPGRNRTCPESLGLGSVTPTFLWLFPWHIIWICLLPVSHQSVLASSFQHRVGTEPLRGRDLRPLLPEQPGIEVGQGGRSDVPGARLF